MTTKSRIGYVLGLFISHPLVHIAEPRRINLQMIILQEDDQYDGSLDRVRGFLGRLVDVCREPGWPSATSDLNKATLAEAFFIVNYHRLGEVCEHVDTVFAEWFEDDDWVDTAYLLLPLIICGLVRAAVWFDGASADEEACGCLPEKIALLVCLLCEQSSDKSPRPYNNALCPDVAGRFANDLAQFLSADLVQANDTERQVLCRKRCGGLLSGIAEVSLPFELANAGGQLLRDVSYKAFAMLPSDHAAIKMLAREFTAARTT